MAKEPETDWTGRPIPPIAYFDDRKAAEHIIGIIAGITAMMTNDDEPWATMLHRLNIEIDRRWYRDRPPTPEEVQTVINRLREAGSEGLDRSPGDPLAKMAAAMLVKLYDRVLALEAELKRREAASEKAVSGSD